jgi:broad specificity phosphatase PhoE
MRSGLFCCLLACLALPHPASPAETVILVRHAEKAQAPAADPPLTPAGRQRAELLASMLAGAGVQAIYATEYQRTRQTAQPLAARLHLTVESINAKDQAALLESIRSRKEGVALVVGHSNTVPAIISGLGGPPVEIPDSAFDDFFILTISGRDVSLLKLRYGEAPAGSPPAAPSEKKEMLEKKPR